MKNKNKYKKATATQSFLKQKMEKYPQDHNTKSENYLH